MRHGGIGMALTALAVALAACVSDRARPMEPTGERPGGGSGAPSSSSAARIDLVTPGPGDTILRETFIEPPGQEVVVRGVFHPGQVISFEGFANRYGPIPFHTEVYEVNEEGVTEVTRLYRAQVGHLVNSDRALITTEVRDDAVVVARDSVRIEIR